MSAIRQLRGVAEIRAALSAGQALGTILVEEGPRRADADEVLALAKQQGVLVREVSAAVIGRMSSLGEPASMLALLGRNPGDSFDAVLEKGGSIWVLLGVAYPTNAGVAIRTAEGCGASAIVIDAPSFDHVARRSATRTYSRRSFFFL